MEETQITELKSRIAKQIFEDLGKDNEVGNTLAQIISYLITMSVDYTVEEVVKDMMEAGRGN